MKRETLSVRDMYADLEKIEARGKRKKDKSKGLFSSFGKKDEPEANDSTQEAVEPVAAAPVEEPPKQEPVPEPQPKPAPVVELPKPQPTPKPAPVVQQPRPQPAPPSIETPPESTPNNPGWTPPTGSKLKKAEESLMAYKRWLNNGFKSGVLTKQQCVDMVKAKEIELGLRPSE